MTSAARRIVLGACLALLLAARVPAPDAAQHIAALALAALVGFATLAAPWRPAERLRPAILLAAAALALLPASPGALLGFLPWPVTAVTLVLLLHHAFPPPGAPAGPRRSALRLVLPLASLALAVGLPLLLPLLLPPHVAALHELRPIGAALVAGLALATLLLAAALLLRGLVRLPPADVEVPE